MSTETAATVNADDLRTVLNQRIGHSHSRPGIWDDDNVRSGLAGKPCEECAARERLAAALVAASPVPSEPPPGVYRDDSGAIWKSSLRVDGKQWWFTPGMAGDVYDWPQLRKVIAPPLVPLFSVDELIPDPDDPKAFIAFCDSIAAATGTRLGEVDCIATNAALRELRARARAEARGPQTTGGNDAPE